MRALLAPLALLPLSLISPLLLGLSSACLPPLHRPRHNTLTRQGALRHRLVAFQPALYKDTAGDMNYAHLSIGS